ncbi:hybrid sensor histidine kinase/response regulator [Seonamhaeicola marinus]|uniref:histidine kinase n=1 Tax=Seonamhaeicola marinus TaxID=1912246 RepID=A0A5D0I5G3_9FLAO|nr:two-component regulator propeller domain-containing protein [Seonamhaeicola marinus]TYA78618.1 response regulator [Seonamhaeicola marinus]
MTYKLLKHLSCIVLLLFSVGHSYAQKFIDNFQVTQYKLPIETSAKDILEDSYGFLWIASTNGLWRYNGSNFKNYIKNEEQTNSITDNNISCLYEDQNKVLWIGTYGGGLLKYNRECDCFESFIHDEENPQSLSFNEVRTIFETKNKTLYIGTDGGGLNELDRETHLFKSFKHSAQDTLSLSHNNVLALEEDPDGNLLVGTWIGLNIFNPIDKKITRVHPSLNKEPQPHFSLEYYNGKLITSFKNFSIYRADSIFKPMNISNNSAQFVKQENSRNCWFLNGNKVSILNEDLKLKQEINLNKLFNSEYYFILDRVFHNKNKNTSWVLARDGSFFHFEKNTSPFKPFSKKITGYSRISKIDSNNWVSYNQSIYVYNNTGQARRINNSFEREPHIATQHNKNVWVVDARNLYEYTVNGDLLNRFPLKTDPRSVLLTRNGNLWIGEILGAKKFNINTKEVLNFECDPDVPNGIGYFHWTSKIFEDHQGQIWIGTNGDGLKKYVPESNEFIHYRHKIGDKTSLNNNFVNDIFEDKEHNLWIGTRVGLCKLNRETSTFFQCENQIIKDKIINSIQQDSENNLWLGTLNGLIKYNYENDSARILNRQDGVLSHKIGTSSIHLNTNELVFGTTKGLMRFNPKEIRESTKSSDIYISKLWVNNEVITPNTSYISKNIEVEKDVFLGHKDKKFEFEFQVINFNNNGRCKFAYKLDGYDKTWIQAYSNQKATYTNIPSGNYTFMIKASNEDGVWSNTIKKINVFIKPPFWEQLWVEVLALITIILLFVLIIWLIIKRERSRSQFEIEKERVLQAEELTKLKLKFFTNISHELRTPLTLISSPLNKYIQEKTKPTNKVLEMMYRNSARLLELVNQILDFRKLETNQKLQIRPYKTASVFNNINTSLQYWAKEKNIAYNSEFPNEAIEAYFDEDVIKKITTNLLSNAFKYTPQGGKVSLIVKFLDTEIDIDNTLVNGTMEIHVIDNGSGIPEEYQEKVFERFYQLDENPDFGYSSGIGLSLTSELVKLHKGSIELKSNKDEGSYFKVKIPVGLNSYENTFSKIASKLPEIDSNKTVILIVEDNHDIRNYIKEELKAFYQVIEAENGKTGLQIAVTILPDIIISDIMMPESDGIQLANQLKSNELTAHIPLLFLTAKTGTENKIAGLNTGANDYIQKPFNISEIKLKINNILESRQQLLKKHLKDKSIANNTSKENTPDKYLEKVNLVLENNLDNSEFSIEHLCKELAVTRSQLYRKIQALTGKSIIEYVNAYRLSIAMQLIKEGTFTLKEITYKVGYNDNRYFSRIFKKEFGNPPSFYLPKPRV